MLILSSVITLSLFFLIETPHELARQKKCQEIEIILGKIRGNISNSEIQKEIEMLRTLTCDESDSQGFIHKFRKLNWKKVTVSWVVYVLMTNLSGINIIASYLLEIFSNIQVKGSILVVCYGASEMIFSFLQMLIADKFGR